MGVSMTLMVLNIVDIGSELSAMPEAADLDTLVEELYASFAGSTGTLWVFGYASLIWRPGFRFKSRIVGHITGYARVFSQGTTTHRGTPAWPGRVATLEPADIERKVWGVAYEVRGADDARSALAHLAERELITGGYRFATVQFHPIDCRQDASSNGSASNDAQQDVDDVVMGICFPIQAYIAEPANTQYLGNAPIDILAYQIAVAHGVCGDNIEYVRRVVDFLNDEVPVTITAEDDYVFELVRAVEDFYAGKRRLSPDQMRKMPISVKEAKQDLVFEHQLENEVFADNHDTNGVVADAETASSVPVCAYDIHDNRRRRRSSVTALTDNLRTFMVENNGSLWIFAHASLIWKPRITYKKRIVGYIEGFKRRMYQGSTTHRGVIEWPARVALLEPEPNGSVWGVAYEVRGSHAIEEALEFLAERELITRGYYFDTATFHARDDGSRPAGAHNAFPVHLLVTEATNPLYLGWAPIDQQAYQIAKARGVCGANVDYLRNLNRFMAEEVVAGVKPDVYLSELTALVERFTGDDAALKPTSELLLQVPKLTRTIHE